MDNRRAMNGILLVLHMGVAWRHLSRELGYGSGVTCWRRLREWQEAGVWARLHRGLLAELDHAGEIDWSGAVVDSSHVRALWGAPHRAFAGRPCPRVSKHHVLTESRGLPLAVAVSGGHRNDVTQLIPLVDAMASMEARDGWPHAKPERIVADRGYDHDKHRTLVRERGIEPVIARRRTEHGSGLGKERWAVERTISWLHQFRCLRIRWERDPEIHLAFMHLACAIVCWRRLRSL